jgi:hypothetical protein
MSNSGALKTMVFQQLKMWAAIIIIAAGVNIGEVALAHVQLSAAPARELLTKADGEKPVPAGDAADRRAVSKDGLSVSIEAIADILEPNAVAKPTQVFTAGQKLNFRVTYKNVSDRTFELYDVMGYRISELMVSDGKNKFLFCPPPNSGVAPPVNVSIKPGGTHEYYLSLFGNYIPFDPKLKELPAGRYSFTATVSFNMPKNAPTGVAYWAGSIVCTQVDFEIITKDGQKR